jgi:hypothetical protein
MLDITFCSGGECRLKYECFRYVEKKDSSITCDYQYFIEDEKCSFYLFKYGYVKN